MDQGRPPVGLQGRQGVGSMSLKCETCGGTTPVVYGGVTAIAREECLKTGRWLRGPLATGCQRKHLNLAENDVSDTYFR